MVQKICSIVNSSNIITYFIFEIYISLIFSLNLKLWYTNLKFPSLSFEMGSIVGILMKDNTQFNLKFPTLQKKEFLPLRR